jgi:hypothetical protein
MAEGRPGCMETEQAKSRKKQSDKKRAGKKKVANLAAEDSSESESSESTDSDKAEEMLMKIKPGPRSKKIKLLQKEKEQGKSYNCLKIV